MKKVTNENQDFIKNAKICSITLKQNKLAPNSVGNTK
jgi:hypothetical protein